MNKSIEDIWEEGGNNTTYLIVPKVINLYDRKSALTIDKLKSVSRKDNLSIIPISILFVVYLGVKGVLYTGLYGGMLMMLLFFLNEKRLEMVRKVDLAKSCSEYLVRFQELIKTNIRFYTRLLGLGLPFAGYLGFVIFLVESKKISNVLDKYSINEFIIVSVIFLIGLSLIGILSYRISTHLVYGKLIKKIDEMIEDLKYLKA